MMRQSQIEAGDYRSPPNIALGDMFSDEHLSQTHDPTPGYTANAELSMVAAKSALYEPSSPIYRLPPEILSEVFEWLVAVYCQGSLHPKLRFKWWETFPELHSYKVQRQHWSPVDYWIGLLLVCRHWRDVAVSTPGLWTHVNLNERVMGNDETFVRRSKWASTSLERSGTLPLALYCTRSADTANLSAILPAHRPRVRELFLHNTRDEYSLLPLLDNCRSLAVLVMYQHLRGLRRVKKHKATYTLRNLTTLLTHGHSFWRYGKFGNLRHLVVERDISAFQSGAPDLFTVLSQNPHLEDLVLVISITEEASLPPSIEAYTGTSVTFIYMPSLKRVRIQERGCPLLSWLLDRRIIYPEDVARSFNIFEPYDDLPLRGPPFIGHWITKTRHPVERLHVSKNDVYATDGTSATYFSIQGAAQRDFFFAAFMPFFEAQTQELWFSISNDAHFRDILAWQEILERLQSVTTLVFYGGVVETWLGLLTLSTRAFPSMTTLQVHHPNPRCLPHYVDCLRERRKRGHPVETLRFIGASDAWQSDKNRASLEEVVNSVVFLNESPVFTLPEVCTTESTVHAYWPAWQL